MCEGPCLRSFHPKPSSRADAEEVRDNRCTTVGITEPEARAENPWLCPNCRSGLQVCFICYRLGREISEGKGEGDGEVFMCGADFCGQFFHADCVAPWIVRLKRLEPPEISPEVSPGVSPGVSPEDREMVRAEEVKRVADGIRGRAAGEDNFICPRHTCVRCRKGGILSGTTSGDGAAGSGGGDGASAAAAAAAAAVGSAATGGGDATAAAACDGGNGSAAAAAEAAAASGNGRSKIGDVSRADLDSEKNKLVPCRRCPTVFHLQCLPRNLPKSNRRAGEGRPQRVWGLSREFGGDGGDGFPLMLYCDRHRIGRE
ncbi:hypothetical protein CLOP_g19405 [Closterium sp. NIES-67]|nr:hypothetical protein CLOP_g19405 [Closterium sp. NIES-67]